LIVIALYRLTTAAEVLRESIEMGFLWFGNIGTTISQATLFWGKIHKQNMLQRTRCRLEEDYTKEIAQVLLLEERELLISNKEIKGMDVKVIRVMNCRKVQNDFRTQ